MKILIVDDNRNARNLIRSLLKPHGHEILEATNGSDAIRIYASELPGCVLMDFEMEGMDGISTTEVIRKSYPLARIFIVTMFDDADIRDAALKAGAEKFILKEDLLSLPVLVEI
jgi:CheY-like chemotaxis protein